MDRQTKIANSFFDLHEDYFLQIISSQINLQKKFQKENSKISLKFRHIASFDYIFGINKTLPYFLNWVINNEKIEVPENTIFVYRNMACLFEEANIEPPLTYVMKSMKWIYTDGKLVDIGNKTMKLSY